MGVDDVWASDTEEEFAVRQGSHPAADLDREWQARQNQFHTFGYRDGVEAGKNSSVQEGFNVGYAEAAVAGFNWGVVRGATSALAALPATLKERLLTETGAVGRLEVLKTSISSLSSTDALRLYFQNSVKPVEFRPTDSNAALGSTTRAEDERLISLPREEGEHGDFVGTPEPLEEPSPVSMAGVNRLPITQSEGNWKPGGSDGLDQFPKPVSETLSSLSSSSSYNSTEAGLKAKTVEPSAPTLTHRKSIGKPDGDTARMVSGTDLEEALKKESVLDSHEEIGPLSVPSTPVRTEMVELQNKVRTELELASIKLGEIASSAL